MMDALLDAVLKEPANLSPKDLNASVTRIQSAVDNVLEGKEEERRKMCREIENRDRLHQTTAHHEQVDGDLKAARAIAIHTLEGAAKIWEAPWREKLASAYRKSPNEMNKALKDMPLYDGGPSANYFKAKFSRLNEAADAVHSLPNACTGGDATDVGMDGDANALEPPPERPGEGHAGGDDMEVDTTSAAAGGAAEVVAVEVAANEKTGAASPPKFQVKTAVMYTGSGKRENAQVVAVGPGSKVYTIRVDGTSDGSGRQGPGQTLSNVPESQLDERRNPSRRRPPPKPAPVPSTGSSSLQPGAGAAAAWAAAEQETEEAGLTAAANRGREHEGTTAVGRKEDVGGQRPERDCSSGIGRFFNPSPAPSSRNSSPVPSLSSTDTDFVCDPIPSVPPTRLQSLSAAAAPAAASSTAPPSAPSDVVRTGEAVDGATSSATPPDGVVPMEQS